MIAVAHASCIDPKRSMQRLTCSFVQNIEQNPAHYALPWVGGKQLHWNASTVGAGVHFNPMVAWKGQVCATS